MLYNQLLLICIILRILLNVIILILLDTKAERLVLSLSQQTPSLPVQTTCLGLGSIALVVG